MQDSPHKLGLILDTITDGILVVDVTGTVLYANQAATTILERGPLTGKSLGIPLGGQHDSFLEINLVRRSGLGWAELRSTPIDWEGIQAFVIGLRDITELKTSQSELEFLTHHDPLTKLPNRLLFLTQLQHAIDKAQRRRISLAVLMMDLDHFKNINDSFGHRVGDDLLHIMADRLKHHIRSTDLPCRLGGDEFVVMIEDIPHAESVARIANQIIGVLNESCTSENGQEMRVGVSIGIAIFPDHGLTASELMQHADAALYQAKKEGRNRFKYFSEDLTRTARARLDTEWHLRQSIEKNQLHVFFQPQFAIASGRLVGAEALLRWQRDGQWISPMDFIPIAEETGLIDDIGEWVLRQTCLQGRRWLDAGLPPLRLAVNLSPRQFLHSDIADMVEQVLAETGFPADHLELELTESAVMSRELESIAIMNQLRALGVSIAIDDFGTGYSSLAYLKLFPLDVLKIDKRFIQDIPRDRDDQEITAAIIAIARTLHLQVIAEGVETAEQLDFLRQQGCDVYQGYLASKPLPIGQFQAQWLEHSQ